MHQGHRPKLDSRFTEEKCNIAQAHGFQNVLLHYSKNKPLLKRVQDSSDKRNWGMGRTVK